MLPASVQMLSDPFFLPKLLVIRSKIYSTISNLSVAYATGNEPFPAKDGRYKKAHKFSVWAKGHAFTCAQFHITGSVPKGEDKNDLALLINITGEGQLFDKAGTPIIGMTTKFGGFATALQAHPAKTLIPLDKITDNDDIDFYMDAGYNGLRNNGIVFGVKLVRINKPVKEFYYDFLFAAYIYRAEKDAMIKKTLAQAFDLFVKDNHNEASCLVKDVVNRYKGVEDSEIYMVGHSHLDLVWLWPKRETIRKSARTFSNQLCNIDNYGGYIYGASQPQQFEWIKERHPALFERLREEFCKGNLDLQGAMWVEADTNLSGGEALVRQIKYGQKFWKDNFDFTSTVCWLPDVFGYSGNLPQILAKSGVNNFMTIKLSWNAYNKFPYHTFYWKGIDDSEVLVHMPPSGNYVGEGTPVCIKDTVQKNTEKNVKKLLFEFGYGDGGGGAGEIQMEMVSRAVKAPQSSVRYAGSEKYFADLRSEGYDLPTYKGELYLEKHQGTYTTQGKMKKYNRRLEFLLAAVESVWTGVLLKNGEYPAEKIEKIWKDMLFYQFHDSLPGSSIGRVYREGNAHQEEMISSLNQLLAEGLAKSDKKDEVYFNAAPVRFHGAFLADSKCYRIDAPARATAKPVLISEKNASLRASDYTIENDHVLLRFENDGSFELFDKTQKSECGRFNEMRIYLDPRVFYNAWEIARWYSKLPRFKLSCTRVENKVVGDALIREQTLRFGHSYIKQRIILFSDSSVVRVENTALLNRRHHMYRCDNHPIVWSEEVTCDIQFGNIKRRTTNLDSIEKARYEICSHKYLDINDGNRGIAFMSDCKYGSKVKDGLVSLTCVRNPVYPDPKADRGEQSFIYEFYPYKGQYEQSDVVEKSYILNNPCQKATGECNPLFDISKGIIPETIKKSDKGNNIVLRVYEPHGKNMQCEIKPHFKYKKVYETDLQENNQQEINIKNILFSPFEIKTYLFEI